MGLLDRVRQLTEPQRIKLGIFDREPIISLAVLLALPGGITWLVLTILGVVNHEMFVSRVYWYLAVLAVTGAAYYFVSVTFYPYCAFETRRWTALENWRDWAVKGFFAALLFDVGLVMLLNRITAGLGFTLQTF
jgi:hypothetical protein